MGYIGSDGELEIRDNNNQSPLFPKSSTSESPPYGSLTIHPNPPPSEPNNPPCVHSDIVHHTCCAAPVLASTHTQCSYRQTNQGSAQIHPTLNLKPSRLGLNYPAAAPQARGIISRARWRPEDLESGVWSLKPNQQTKALSRISPPPITPSHLPIKSPHPSPAESHKNHPSRDTCSLTKPCFRIWALSRAA